MKERHTVSSLSRMARSHHPDHRISGLPRWSIVLVILLWAQWLGVVHRTAHALADSPAPHLVGAHTLATLGLEQSLRRTATVGLQSEIRDAQADPGEWIDRVTGHKPGTHCAAWDDATHPHALVAMVAGPSLPTAPPLAAPGCVPSAGCAPQVFIPALGSRAPPRSA
jgi:hypothetical protein